jgi:hypothetical protein
MKLSEKYVKAMRSGSNVVEEIFRKMSTNCKFYHEEDLKVGNSHLTLGRCFYHGRPGAGPCAREVCPILEDKE